jgi:hypothetical protein
MASPRELDKRLAALERAILTRRPQLILVWTRNLADRIEKALAASGTQSPYRLVCLTFATMEDELDWEAGLRKANPEEAARLDMLLEGRLPP